MLSPLVCKLDDVVLVVPLASPILKFLALPTDKHLRLILLEAVFMPDMFFKPGFTFHFGIHMPSAWDLRALLKGEK